MSDLAAADLGARAIVMMGVSGSGKTTLGAMLAAKLGWCFADADDFHSAANIEKMQSGKPLNDADRMPWLEAIHAQIIAWLETGKGGVVSCSALKRIYRDIVIGKSKDVQLIYLKGDREIFHRRLVARHDHFMPASLLDSQFIALEEPAADEHPLTVEADKNVHETLDTILRALKVTPNAV